MPQAKMTWPPTITASTAGTTPRESDLRAELGLFSTLVGLMLVERRYRMMELPQGEQSDSV
jgi:hypothetical protein